MKTFINFGIIGVSEGNGHPYSWSSIFNGYNTILMKESPYPVIYKYLNEQKFPDDFLVDKGRINAIWTQNTEISIEIANAALIPNICSDILELSDFSDAILLARDDAENHFEMAVAFIDMGLPIYIDKPLSLNYEEALLMFNRQVYQSQIFTCSSLRYATELFLTKQDLDYLGWVEEVEGYCPKYWDTYAVHLIESIITNCKNRGELNSVEKITSSSWHIVEINWENLLGKIFMTKEESHLIDIIYINGSKRVKKTFSDSFSCFKKSLEMFVEQINSNINSIPRKETLEIIKIIEDGR
jgi:hypothetical protein